MAKSAYELLHGWPFASNKAAATEGIFKKFEKMFENL
jgi:hypothetical protein